LPVADLQNAAADLVRRSRAEQGLPPTISDPAVLARVIDLLAPDDLDAGGIESVEAA
jgi:hypothetical protein